MKNSIVVIGGGESGVGAAYLASKKGYNVFVSEFNTIQKKYKKIFWINPEQSKYWNTGDSQMKKFEEINYKTVEVRNYKQLKDFIKEIDLKKVLSL